MTLFYFQSVGPKNFIVKKNEPSFSTINCFKWFTGRTSKNFSSIMSTIFPFDFTKCLYIFFEAHICSQLVPGSPFFFGTDNVINLEIVIDSPSMGGVE